MPPLKLVNGVIGTCRSSGAPIPPRSQFNAVRGCSLATSRTPASAAGTSFSGPPSRAAVRRTRRSGRSSRVRRACPRIRSQRRRGRCTPRRRNRRSWSRPGRVGRPAGVVPGSQRRCRCGAAPLCNRCHNRALEPLHGGGPGLSAVRADAGPPRHATQAERPPGSNPGAGALLTANHADRGRRPVAARADVWLVRGGAHRDRPDPPAAAAEPGRARAHRPSSGGGSATIRARFGRSPAGGATAGLACRGLPLHLLGFDDRLNQVGCGAGEDVTQRGQGEQRQPFRGSGH